MTIRLETPRLVLREMTLGDLDFFAAMLADPEVMRYYPSPLDRAGAEGWVRRQLDRYASHGYGFWLALGRVTGEPVGQAGLIPKVLDGVDEVDVGYMIHRPYWRRGYASEAAAACRDHAFHALDRPRVVCTVRPENEPSLGVARKIGLTPSGRRFEAAGFDHIVFTGERKRFAGPGKDEENSSADDADERR